MSSTQLANQLRAILKDENIPARVQTYRNHEDISIYPTAANGWTNEQFTTIVRMIDGAQLTTLSERVTGRKLVTVNQARGFRYLRAKGG